MSSSGSSIGCEPCLMKRMLQVRIPLLLSLHGHVKKKSGYYLDEYVILLLLIYILYL
jgi:hypothetical protein